MKSLGAFPLIKVFAQVDVRRNISSEKILLKQKFQGETATKLALQEEL